MGVKMSSTLENGASKNAPASVAAPTEKRNSHLPISDDSPIVYHYLEFDSVLPFPATHSAHDGSPPEPPDLKPFADPFEWPERRKRLLVWLSTVSTALAAYASGMYASAVPQMTVEWHISSVAAYVGISIFTVGFGIAPMVLAPFSELVGRRPIFVATGFLWVLFGVFCAVTRLYVGMLLSRLGSGIVSSTFSTMVGGVISDIYRKEDRNTPMTIFTGGVLFGTGIGPLVSGFVGQHLNWRWIFWIHLILIGFVMIFVVFFFYESRGSVLLSRRAKTLNKWYDECERAGIYGVEFPSNASHRTTQLKDGESFPSTVERVRWKVKADEERAGILQMIRISLFRPIHLLFTEPVVFFFALWITFAWMILYLLFSAVQYVFETVYDFSLQESGAVFASVSIAAILWTVISVYQDDIAARLTGKSELTPETRLRFPCFWSAFLPISLFIFGWTATKSVPWIVPTIFGVGFATVGIFSIYLATFNYLADCYKTQASSAIAAQSMCRNLIGGAVPLYTEAMYKKLTIGGASSLLGGIALVLTIVPWVLTYFGPQIRARSKIARETVE